MPTATIFTYDTSHRKLMLRSRFYWKLYGRTHSSKFGKYVYEEKGMLSGIRHLRPTESVVIVGNANAPVLREFFTAENARFSEHKIILSGKEYAMLKR